MGGIVVVKYNAGNIRSVLCALQRIGCDAVVSDDPDVLRSASRVIFPGVGEAASAIHYLRHTHLDEVLISLTQPFLGICLGLQLMCSFSEEHDTSCLHIFNVPVVRFPRRPLVKVPHMGWNTVEIGDDPLFSGLHTPIWCYFVHSYYVPSSSETIASCAYGDIVFSAALRSKNYRGLQFHPEKSGAAGQQILRNFLFTSEDLLCL